MKYGVNENTFNIGYRMNVFTTAVTVTTIYNNYNIKNNIFFPFE